VKRKNVVVIASCVALLSGGAAGWIALTGHGLAYYFGGEIADPNEPPPDKEPSIFVKIEPMQVVVRSQNGRNYQILLTVNLEVAEPKDRPKVEKMVPRLRDAYLRELYGVPMAAQGQWRADEMDSIKHRLLLQSNRVLGAEMVSSVLIQQAIPINQ
jgi:hypothetical protein